MNECEELEFNEDDAIRYILDFIPQEDRKGLNKEKIQFVLDAIYDYYESEGLIQEDTAEEASIDEEQMLNFVRKEAEEEQLEISDEQIQLILEGEFEYGVSIGIYEPED